MAADGARAHEAALIFWNSKPSANARSRGFAICDRCNGQILRDEGFLCGPAIAHMSGVPDEMLGSPDLLCETCYARHPGSPWVWTTPLLPIVTRKWWEVWR